MINILKFGLYRLWMVYDAHFPIAKGKYKLERLVYRMLGNCVVGVKHAKFDLVPIAYIDKQLMAGKMYEEETYAWLSGELKDGGVFLDIGTNFGLFSVLMAGLGNGVRVISFEPSPREIGRLQKNLVLNGLTNVSVMPFGLGSENTVLKLQLFDGLVNSGKNSFAGVIQGGEQVEVPCYRFDDVLGGSKLVEDVKVMKIDVEGFEFMVLQGMEQFLEGYRGKIVMEITYGFGDSDELDFDSDRVYGYLESKGFRGLKGKGFAKQYNEIFEKAR